MLERSTVRSRRLQAALDHLHGRNALVEDLTDWLADVHAKLLAANDMPAPSDVAVLKAMIRQHTVRVLMLVEIAKIVIVNNSVYVVMMAGVFMSSCRCVYVLVQICLCRQQGRYV